MSDFDIKSPLPPRKVPTLDGSEDTSNVAPPTSETVPPLPAEPPHSLPPPKEVNLKKFLPILGIVGVLILIGVVVSKFLLPNLRGVTNQTETTLTYWGLWEDNSTLEGIINEYESKNPGVKIVYRKNSKTDYRTRLQGRLSKADTAEEVPDIFRIHATWLPMMKDYLAPVPSDIATTVQLDGDFYNTYKSDIKENGKYWGIPLMYDGLALFYNKSILDSAGIQPPKTWWGLRDAAKKLTVKDPSGKINVAGVAMGVTDNVDHWSDIIGAMMKQNGVDVFKGDDANTQKLKGVLTFYTLFRTTDQVWDESLPPSTQAFANGKLAFYFAPSWRIFDIDAMNPSLNYAVAPIPQLPTLDGVDPAKIESGEIQGNLTQINWSSYWIEGVNAKSKNQKEAWKFLTFLAAKENLEKFYQSASAVRSFGEIYPRKSMAAELASNVKVKAFTDMADTASNWYLASRTFDDGVNDEMTKYFTDAINGIVQKNSTPDEVMPALQAGISQVVAKYRLTRM
ncbi:extracellular solute-binding protein [Patescibacteria group bacterium]|nr:extracellular solute-binding protein [Patescibacteria group bacterium]